MAWLLRKIFWLALFLIATFGFVVLFEHGTDNYVQNAEAEFHKLRKSLASHAERPKDKSDKVGR